MSSNRGLEEKERRRVGWLFLFSGRKEKPCAQVEKRFTERRRHNTTITGMEEEKELSWVFFFLRG